MYTLHVPVLKCTYYAYLLFRILHCPCIYVVVHTIFFQVQTGTSMEIPVTIALNSNTSTMCSTDDGGIV